MFQCWEDVEEVFRKRRLYLITWVWRKPPEGDGIGSGVEKLNNEFAGEPWVRVRRVFPGGGSAESWVCAPPACANANGPTDCWSWVSKVRLGPECPGP